MEKVENVYLEYTAGVLVAFVLAVSVEIICACRRVYKWIGDRSPRDGPDVKHWNYDPTEVPTFYKYRRGSVSHSWREASVERIKSDTSEYDRGEYSSEYDAISPEPAFKVEDVPEGYIEPEYSSSYNASPPKPPPKRINTPQDELVTKEISEDLIEPSISASAFGRAPPRKEISEDLIEPTVSSSAFGSSPTRKIPPKVPPKPKVLPKSTASIDKDLLTPPSPVTRRRIPTPQRETSKDVKTISYENNTSNISGDKDKNRLIFSGEYTKAMDQDWHSGHFCCWNCDLNLTGHRYILREDHPYCIKCYENLFANTCEECKTPIGTDSKDLSYKEKHWHEKCFKCIDCQNSLVDQPFSSKDNKLYCADCHDNNFAARCDGCTNIFKAGMKKFEYKGKQWHEECFCCSVCKQPIGNKSFIPRDQEVVCVPCYEENFAQRCLKCSGVINKGGITYKGTPWHKECFTCTNCNKILSGEKFTSREDKPYCADCFGDLFAKKCIRCTKPITGLGGTKFISFEERHWHSDCFLCYKCNTSLVGRGFLTDGDDILCPECGRA